MSQEVGPDEWATGFCGLAATAVSLALTSLFEEGRVAYAAYDTLIIDQHAELGTLNDGIWPCTYGGLRGNHVVFLQDS